jgi:hypothetical protein
MLSLIKKLTSAGFFAALSFLLLFVLPAVAQDDGNLNDVDQPDIESPAPVTNDDIIEPDEADVKNGENNNVTEADEGDMENTIEPDEADVGNGENDNVNESDEPPMENNDDGNVDVNE